MARRGTSASQTWEAYQAAYLRSAVDGDDAAINEMIRTWDRLKRQVGARRARALFWQWQATLPNEHRSDVDPDGR